MELGTMRESWAAYDRKLEASIALNRRVLAELQTRRVARPLLRLQILTWRHVGAWVLMMGALGNFLASHWGELRFVVPCVLLQFYAVANMAALGQMAMTAAGLDENGAVVAMQLRVERLRVMRPRYLRWSVGSGAALGMAWMVVAVEGLVGLDLFSVVTWRWMAAYIAGSALVVPVTLWVCERFFSGSVFVRMMVEELGGRNLRQAQAALAEVEEFAGIE